MKKHKLLYTLVFTSLLGSGIYPAWAQPKADAVLHVVKTDINAESENAELCIEFDKNLDSIPQSRFAASLHLQKDGKDVDLPTLAATGTSLCLFPLERNKPYHLDISGLRGSGDEKMEAPFKSNFTIPDRSPVLDFTGKNGGVNVFDFYNNPLVLRAVNVPHVNIDVYHVTDISTMAHAWQTRAQTALAPTESAYMAKDKGQAVWHGDVTFDATANVTSEKKIALQDKIPNLAPGLYLIVADAANHSNMKPASKGLAPMAAAWFTRADFSLRALRDDDGIHAFATRTDTLAPKTDLRLVAVNHQFEQIAEKTDDASGNSLVTLPDGKNDIANLIGIDKAGGVAFADIGVLPQAKGQTSSPAIDASQPHLEVSSKRDDVGADGNWPITIRSIGASKQNMPMVSGHISALWKQMDAAAFGWKDYHFGLPVAATTAAATISDFITDEQGQAQLHVVLPKPPQERGLYQAELYVSADADTGFASAAPITAMLRPDMPTVGIKPLIKDGHFPQNGIARFSLIAVDGDGSARDMGGLSYQLYEEGRSFTWFQDDGRWQYKPAAQLRPIGGGSVAIKSDGSSVLEWPVTAGNYRLQILDGNGKPLAQTTFSAGWESTGDLSSPSLPLTIEAPKNLQIGHEAIAHVSLPENAMLTAIIADGHIRKIIHEFHSKGNVALVFTPAADWHDNITLSVSATAAGDAPIVREGVTSLAMAQAPITPVEPALPQMVITPDGSVSGLVLRKDRHAVVRFTLSNKGAVTDIYHYNFLLSGGLKNDDAVKGSVSIGGGQNKTIALSLLGAKLGTQSVQLDVVGAHTPRISQTWNVAVLPKTNGLRSETTTDIEGKQNLFPGAAKDGPPIIALVSRRRMDGLAEILSYVFSARPFTTIELADTIDALRLWRGVLNDTGIAPDFLVDGKRAQMIAQMVKHQNSDGGFGAYRGGISTMEDTAAALTALGADTSGDYSDAKQRAIVWIKQILSNTWVDDSERASRASGYAALAAADAVDIASLHYFSDTSAQTVLPAIAEAHIAAAFKQVRDPNAAAFWIKKMLDENGHLKTIPVLTALAATDALSSDDVHMAMNDMQDALHHNKLPSIGDAASLLRIIAADNADIGKFRLAQRHDSQIGSGVVVVHGDASTLGTYRNDESASLSVTTLANDTAPLEGVIMTRHVYRLNGVELSPSEHPAANEIYMVELKGNAPDSSDDARILIQDRDSSLRPLSCPLSPKMDMMSFIGWFSPHDLSDVEDCEYSLHAMNIVAPASDNLWVVYFAHIDAATIGTLSAARLRVLK